MPLIADIEFGAALGDNELARLFTTVLGVFLSSLYILIGQCLCVPVFRFMLMILVCLSY